ncbi:hypothetical protein Shyhy01_04000 [Streptomyces hygroscopicus subsp. hygroscopicus]|nr:hypothetical protein [Streptomyces hygroscopicus]GLX47450.1 hypothetical protein Shyhy01_04000 [Streptomyces hygroscopicus subsp. hygroscopicus]
MASRASSEAAASPAPARIPELPGLGTTWYRRGPRYWLRRTVNALFLLTVLAFFCYIALVLYSGAPRTYLPRGMRTGWDVTQAVASCVALVWGWTKQRRSHREALLAPPSPGRVAGARRDGKRRVPGLVALGRGLLLLAAPLMPMLAAWCVGWFLALLTVREYPTEVGARRWLEAQTGRSGTS